MCHTWVCLFFHIVFMSRLCSLQKLISLSFLLLNLSVGYVWVFLRRWSGSDFEISWIVFRELVCRVLLWDDFLTRKSCRYYFTGHEVLRRQGECHNKWEISHFFTAKSRVRIECVFVFIFKHLYWWVIWETVGKPGSLILNLLKRAIDTLITEPWPLGSRLRFRILTAKCIK